MLGFIAGKVLTKLGLSGLLRIVVIVAVIGAEFGALFMAYQYGKGQCHAVQLKNAVTVEQKVRQAGDVARKSDTSRSLRDGTF